MKDELQILDVERMGLLRCSELRTRARPRAALVLVEVDLLVEIDLELDLGFDFECIPCRNSKNMFASGLISAY